MGAAGRVGIQAPEKSMSYMAESKASKDVLRAMNGSDLGQKMSKLHMRRF